MCKLCCAVGDNMNGLHYDDDIVQDCYIHCNKHFPSKTLLFNNENAAKK